MAFKPIESVDTKLTGRIELNQPGTQSSGFTPLDPIAASRVKPAQSLEQLIGEKYVGEFPQTSQPLSAFIRGLLSSSLAGTTEGIGALAGANPQFDPSSPQFTNPGANLTGEMIGNLVPLGRLKQVGGGLWNLIKEGGRLGAVQGLGQGVSEVAQSEDPTVSEALKVGATRGLVGAALGSSIPAISGSVVKLIPTKQNILDDLTKLSLGEEGKIQRSTSGGYVQAAEKLTPFLKKGEGVDGFLDASEKALESEAKKFRPKIENASPSYLNPDDIYKQVDLELSKMIPNPETRLNILYSEGDFVSDLTQINPKNFLDYSSKVNREVSRIYKNPSTPITQEALAAKEAIRDVYGNIIRKILEDAGEDPGVYSGYGAIKEMASQIGKNYLKESYKLSSQKGRSIPQNIIQGLEEGGGGLNIGRAAQASISRITEGEKGRLNRQADSLTQGFLSNLIGYGKEKTDAAKAEKLGEALRILNTLNKASIEPVEDVETIESFIRRSTK